MRYVFITLLLALPLSVRAIIPLELVAEFELPGYFSEIDVQYWENEHNIGWAGLRNDTIFWQYNEFEAIDSCIVPTNFFTPNSWYRRFHQIAIVQMESNPLSRLVALTARETTTDEYGVYDYFAFIVLYELGADTALTWHRFDAGRCDSYSLGYCRSATPYRLLAWPPSPAPTSRLIFSKSIWIEYVGPGSDFEETTGGINVFALSSDSILSIGGASLGSFDMVPGTQGDMILANHRVHNAWNNDWESYSRSFYSAQTNTTVSPVNCSSGDYCSASNLLAFRPDSNTVLSVSNYVVRDASTLAILDTLDFNPSYALRPSESEFDWLWRYENNRLVAREMSGAVVDSTVEFEGYFSRVVKRFDGTGILCKFSSSPRTLRAYKLHRFIEELTISYLPAGQMIRLEWQGVAGAARYRVCRMHTHNEDSICDDSFTVTSTATQFALDPALPYEFYTVTAEFE